MTSLLITLLIIIDVAICLLAVLLVMMQRPSQEGLGAAFGGGVTDQMFGAQTTNVLQRGTVYMTIAFFAVNLLLSVLIAKSAQKDKDLGTSLKSGLQTESAEASQVKESNTADKEAVDAETKTALPKPAPIDPSKPAESAPTSQKAIENEAAILPAMVEKTAAKAKDLISSEAPVKPE